MGLTDLEGQIGFYAQYHHNIVNKFIHIICVPIILWTALVWLCFLPPLAPIDLTCGLLPHPVPLDFAFIALTGYVLFYISLETVAGLLYVVPLYSLLYFANVFADTNPKAGTIAVVVHVISWVLQFVGHGFAEKRAPALLDSLIQALVLAPFFVWLELLFMLGYRKDLAHRIDKQAVKDIQRWNNQKKSTKKN
eukprot:TRINITY_DN3082_c0_g1_i1.p1 TRINITY_DN3082_c0_g1~~TRINITY_DN3082_c0_g1_i1.p1  ORF type:complete len:193 (+),score=20.98 TRINITY_DN3082_c0_g1_i1:84-662(+)